MAQGYGCVMGSVYAGKNRELYLALNHDEIVAEFKKQTEKKDWFDIITLPVESPEIILVKLVSPSVVKKFQELYGDDYLSKMHEIL